MTNRDPNHRPIGWRIGRSRKDMGVVQEYFHEIAQETGPSFKEAIQNGRYGVLFGKVATTGVGVAMTLEGVAHIQAGFTERVGDQFETVQPHMNYWRMFLGGLESFTGLGALYLGLTKGYHHHGL